MAGAALAQRQAWWLGTAVSTGAGLGLIVFRPRFLSKLLGIFLLVLPHALGAPEPLRTGGATPPELAAQFTVASLATSALFWSFLGSLTGWLYSRLDPDRAAPGGA
jgi:predicted cobalt transporter CbtA